MIDDKSANKISGSFNRNLFWRVFLWGFAIIVCMIVAFTPDSSSAHDMDTPHCVIPVNEPFSILIQGADRLVDRPLEQFGQVADPLIITSNTNIKYTRFFDIRATVNSIGEKQVLISRDESGQADSGHLTLALQPDGTVFVRNQGAEGSGSITLESEQPVIVGQPFRVGLTVGPAGLFLYLDGEQVGHSDEFWPLSGNDLPLVIGDSCYMETIDSCLSEDRQPAFKFNGTIEVDLYRSEVLFLSGMGIS